MGISISCEKIELTLLLSDSCRPKGDPRHTKTLPKVRYSDHLKLASRLPPFSEKEKKKKKKKKRKIPRMHMDPDVMHVFPPASM